MNRDHAPRSRACAQCGGPFIVVRPLQQVCSPTCARRKVNADKAKQRLEFRARKAAIKTIGELIDDAQYECNRYIRYRDAGKPCFDCGKPFEPNKPGGSMDAGHLRSRGAAGHLRFNENNIFGQRKNCNRPGGATEEAKRAGAVARIGEEAVAALYADNEPHKWQRDELVRIKLDFRARANELKKELKA